jgi:ACR3 family arsenite efflux pump ArsB
MMVLIGLRVPSSELVDTVRDWRLITRAAVANYLCVPVLALALLILFGASPMAATGFLILAVCPGAPYGPPFAGIAGKCICGGWLDGDFGRIIGHRFASAVACAAADGVSR